MALLALKHSSAKKTFAFAAFPARLRSKRSCSSAESFSGHEHLLGRGERREEEFEAGGAVDAVGQGLGQHRLGRAGRTQQQNVFTRHESREEAPHLSLALEQQRVQLGSERLELLVDGHDLSFATCVVAGEAPEGAPLVGPDP